jgi:hypothetical protein
MTTPASLIGNLTEIQNANDYMELNLNPNVNQVKTIVSPLKSSALSNYNTLSTKSNNSLVRSPMTTTNMKINFSTLSSQQPINNNNNNNCNFNRVNSNNRINVNNNLTNPYMSTKNGCVSYQEDDDVSFHNNFHNVPDKPMV